MGVRKTEREENYYPHPNCLLFTEYLDVLVGGCDGDDGGPNVVAAITIIRVRPC